MEQGVKIAMNAFSYEPYNQLCVLMDMNDYKNKKAFPDTIATI